MGLSGPVQPPQGPPPSPMVLEAVSVPLGSSVLPLGHRKLLVSPGPDPARQRQRIPQHGLSLVGLPTLREQPALPARWHVGVAVWVDEANTMYYYTKRAFFGQIFCVLF